jgi:CubicO group peptidase (beta-lactamase class C family)
MTRGRVLVRIVAALIAGAAAALAVACLVYPPVYVYRAVAWGSSDVGDMYRFPARPLRASPAAKPIETAGDGGAVRQAYAAAHGGASLERMLEDTGTFSFLVLRDGKAVYERYFHGTTRDTPVTSFSVAKSVLSMLVGAAIADGRIGGADDPITKYLPELAARDPRFARITIRHLLRMASGIRYEEFPFLNGDDAKTYYYPDLRALALGQTEIAGEPGARFLYNNFHPLLLGVIVERATGTSVTAYLQEKLWTPLGMQFDGSWSLDSETSGCEKLESGVNARALDFARLGQLMLQGGRWGEVQVLPSRWVVESTAPPTAPAAPDYYAASGGMRELPGQYYGLLWWGVDHGGGRHDFWAHGRYGQFIFVSPASGVVIARNGARYGQSPGEWLRTFVKLADSVAGAGQRGTAPR